MHPMHPVPPSVPFLLFVLVSLAEGVGAVSAAPTIDERARREDLVQYRQQVFAPDRAFDAAASREAALQRLAALEARRGEMDTLAFGLELARITALADNGHSMSYAAPRLQRSNRVEIRLVPFGQEFHVLRTREADADLLGARLRAIDGVPLPRLREAAHSLAGGLPAWRDRQAPALFDSPQQLFALGLVAAPEAALYRFQHADGRVVERRLVADPPHETRARGTSDRLLLPEVLPPELGWRAVLPAAQAPWSLLDAGRRFRWRHDAALDALVVEMRAARDQPGEPLPPFFDAVREALATHKPRHMVLDLRLNGGGDLTRTRDFAEQLPTLVPGRLFVLTSPWTFSAAISTAGYLKQAAPARVAVVGEPVGDRLEFFAEGRPVRLKHSGEVLLPATERHDYADGCRRFSDCHGPVVSRPIRVATLAPDVAAAWTFEAYRAGIDPAMQAVARALAGRE